MAILIRDVLLPSEWVATRTTAFFELATRSEISSAIAFESPNAATSPLFSYSTTTILNNGVAIPTQIPCLVVTGDIGAVHDNQGFFLEVTTEAQSYLPPPSNKIHQISTTSGLSTAQASSQTDAPSSLICLATLAPSQTSIPKNSTTCSVWKCWAKSEQAGTLVAIIAVGFGIIAVVWWGLLCKRKNNKMNSGEDIEGGRRGRLIRDDRGHSDLNFGSDYVLKTHTNHSRTSRGRHLSCETPISKAPIRRDSNSLTRTLQGEASKRPMPSAHETRVRSDGAPFATTIGRPGVGVTIAGAKRNGEGSGAGETPGSQRRKIRLASPSKYLPKQSEMRERDRQYRSEPPLRNVRDDNRNDDRRRTVPSSKNIQDDSENDRGKEIRAMRDRNLELGREKYDRTRPRSHSQPRRILSSEKPQLKRRNSNLESKPDGPSRWLLLLPLALEAVHLLSEPKGGWNSYLPDHKKHKPRIERLANDFLEGKHRKRSSHDRDNDRPSLSNDEDRTPRSRPPIQQRSSSADMTYSRYKPSWDPPRRPKERRMGSPNEAADYNQPIRRSNSTRVQEPEPSRRRSTRQDVRAWRRSMNMS